MTRVWHSGDEKMMDLIGPSSCFTNDNMAGVQAIGPSDEKRCDGKPENDGMVRYAAKNGLQPGDVIHYTVVANLSQTGTYDIQAEYGRYDISDREFKPSASDSSTLTVYCSLSCLWRRHQNVILSIIGIVIGLIGIVLTSETLRNKALAVANGAYERICWKA